jgi:hypothetical protein
MLIMNRTIEKKYSPSPTHVGPDLGCKGEEGKTDLQRNEQSESIGTSLTYAYRTTSAQVPEVKKGQR